MFKIIIYKGHNGNKVDIEEAKKYMLEKYNLKCQNISYACNGKRETCGIIVINEKKTKSPLQIRIPIPKPEKMIIKVNTKKMKVVKDEDEDFESESVSSSVDEEELSSDDYEEEDVDYQKSTRQRKQTRKR